MRLNRKWLSIGAVSTMAIVLTITAVCTSDTKAVKDNKEVAETVVSTEDVTAGISAAISEIEENTEAAATNAVATVQKEEVDVVALPEEVEEDTAAFYDNWLVADVDSCMNVRVEADEEADLVGKLHKGDLATVVTIEGDWTKIKSGNVEGYVKSEYTLVGSEAYQYVNENCDTVAEVLINGLRIREEMSTDAGVVKTLAEGDKVVVDKTAAVGEGWVAVKYNKKICYVSADYVKVSLDTGVALTMKEEAAKAAEEKAAAEKAAAEKAAKSSSKTSSNQKESSGTTQGTSLAATADDVTLLAAIIQCEAGGQSYDCQLAVGAVVVNRVKSGSYPNNVHDVIFQKSQFGPVSNGALEKRLAKGVSDTAYQAAQAALAGEDNTGGAIGFKLSSSGHDGVVIGPIVFF